MVAPEHRNTRHTEFTLEIIMGHYVYIVYFLYGKPAAWYSDLMVIQETSSHVHPLSNDSFSD